VRSISSSSSTRLSAPSTSRARERVERDADHLLGPRGHLVETLDQRLVGRQPVGELRQLRDRHAEVGHPLEVQVRVQDREHEPQVDGDRRLAREQRLDALLEREVARIDVVVERDHLVRELGSFSRRALIEPRTARRTRSPSSSSDAWSVSISS
jgi:hypothetical protein